MYKCCVVRDDVVVFCFRVVWTSVEDVEGDERDAVDNSDVDLVKILVDNGISVVCIDDEWEAFVVCDVVVFSSLVVWTSVEDFAEDDAVVEDTVDTSDVVVEVSVEVGICVVCFDDEWGTFVVGVFVDEIETSEVEPGVSVDVSDVEEGISVDGSEDDAGVPVDEDIVGDISDVEYGSLVEGEGISVDCSDDG